MIDPTEEDDDGSKTGPGKIKEERISNMDKFEEEHRETEQDDGVKYPGPAYSQGKRTQTKPVAYEPVMTGKTYKQGINNICFKGIRYTPNEVIPNGI